MSTLSNPAELRRRGLEILVRELGYADAMRFLLQYETGHGDYTRDRHLFLHDSSIEEMAARANQLVAESES